MPELTKEMIASFKKNNKNESASIPETYCEGKTLPKISKSIMNFATKVHESLKGE